MTIRSRLQSLGVIAAVIGLFAATGTALSFVAPEHAADFEVPLPSFDQTANRSAAATDAADAASRVAIEQMRRAYDGDWKVYSTNPIIGTPRWVYGSGAQVAPAFAQVQDAVDAAREVIRANPDVFHVSLAGLRTESAPRGAGKQAVHFQQVYQMLDVIGGGASVTFTDSGRMFLVGSTCYSGINVDPTPRLTMDEARDRAHADLTLDPATDRVEERPKLMILPVPTGPNSVEHHLVWRVRVDVREPRAIWVTFVDAHDGQILWRYNDVQFLDYTGTAAGLVERPTYCEGQASEPMPYLRVQISGLSSVTADAFGNWNLTYAGTDPRAVTADLYSPYVDVNNVAGGQGTFTGTATPGTPLAINFTDANSQRDEKDVYRAVNDIHNFFQTFAPEFAYPSGRITANVSRNSTCNAYWDGTINFYVAGAGCANTGQIMDVVQHEFGHGVQDAILGGQGNEGLGEGNGDILGNIMQMSPIVGRGFYLNTCTSGIRNSQNTLRYPGDVVGQEIHDAGRVIAGFQWDAMQAMIATLGPEAGRLAAARDWHYGRVLEHPMTQPDQVLATFVADDDDGNLSNGTPNHAALCLAATNHGFTCPEILTGVLISHTPLASREGAGPATVTASIYSTEGALVADSVAVRYRLNGGPFQSVVMLPTGGTNEYAATIPDLSPPTQVEYYLRARDVAGNTRTSPSLAPDVLHAFDVATKYDNLEAESGWTVNLEGTDNAVTGQWVRVDPNATIAQPEDDHTPAPGVLCWVTGNAPAGSADGTADVDGGTTTLYTPVYDLSAYGTALVKYWRWYSNDLGGAPAADTWVVRARNNGGAWVTVESTMLSSNAWVSKTVDLALVFGASLGQVQFKFVASDLASPSLIEAAVDDFEILAQGSTVDVAPVAASGPARFALFGTRPNPALGATRIDFQVPGTSQVQLGVHDVSGRVVRSFSGIYAAGTHSVEWDGRDGSGRILPSGVYFVRMQADAFRASRSVILSR
jgi:Zn-dependent metalloprotease